MYPLTLNRRLLTRTNIVTPSLLGLASTPSLTGKDLRCPAHAYDALALPDKAIRNQYKLQVHVPSAPQPAPDSDERGPAPDARTGPHFLPD